MTVQNSISEVPQYAEGRNGIIIGQGILKKF